MSEDLDFGAFGPAVASLFSGGAGDAANARRLVENMNSVMPKEPSVLGFAAVGKLRGAEKRAFQAAAADYLEKVTQFDDDDCLDRELPPFDLLSPYHRLEIIAGLVTGLLLRTTPLPAESIENHAAFQAVFLHLLNCIELECDSDDDWDSQSTEDGQSSEDERCEGEEECVGVGSDECVDKDNGSALEVPITPPANAGCPAGMSGSTVSGSSDAADTPGVSVPKPAPAADGNSDRSSAPRIKPYEMSKYVEEMVREGHAIGVQDRHVYRKARAELTNMRESSGPAKMGNLSGSFDPESEMEGMKNMLRRSFGESKGKEDKDSEEEGLADISEDEYERRVKRHPFRYHWRTLYHELIQERHGANSLAKSLMPELHVAAQSTMFPPKWCVDYDRWVMAHRMTFGAGFPIKLKESHLSGGALDLGAVARGDSEAVQRLDIISRRVDQKGMQFAKTWSPEKSLFNMRTIFVLCDEEMISKKLDTAGFGQLEKALVDGEGIPPNQDYYYKLAVKLLWRRRFQSQMEGQQFSNLNARFSALRRVMDSERALGLHKAVWPYHGLSSAAGEVHSHDAWFEWARKHRPWNSKARPDSQCLHCKKDSKEGEKFAVCSKCKSADYCCRECQILDWKKGGHKLVCKKWAEDLQKKLG